MHRHRELIFACKQLFDKMHKFNVKWGLKLQYLLQILCTFVCTFVIFLLSSPCGFKVKPNFITAEALPGLWAGLSLWTCYTSQCANKHEWIRRRGRQKVGNSTLNLQGWREWAYLVVFASKTGHSGVKVKILSFSTKCHASPRPYKFLFQHNAAGDCSLISMRRKLVCEISGFNV